MTPDEIREKNEEFAKNIKEKFLNKKNKRGHIDSPTHTRVKEGQIDELADGASEKNQLLEELVEKAVQTKDKRDKDVIIQLPNSGRHLIQRQSIINSCAFRGLAEA